MFTTKPRLHAELLASDLAGAIPMSELETLDRLATTIWLDAGEQIVAKNRFGRECFVVIEGEFEVERDELTVIVGPGTILGEMALLTLQPRTASVTATTDSSVYVLNRAEFATLLDTCPNFSQYVLDGAARRAAA